MDKTEKLLEVRRKLEENAAKLPLARKTSDTVPGEGNPEAEIMFIGEAAGYYESIERRPFVGPAGKLLSRCLESVNLRRSDVYISNILKVRPPNNRDPEPAEIAAYKPYLDAEIRIIKPKVIVTLGRFSMAKFFGPLVRISQIHGSPRWVSWEGRQILIVPMYHPAAALRAGRVMADFAADFAKLPHFLKLATHPPIQATATKTPEPELDEQLNLI
ncbi:MAG: uracil-DNA glycosylase [Candidatus Chisholmbacteria bacterium]|nr:uracil-DNA glycosylase [Candidatus Chisholmbacteria bacterium]